MVDSEMAGRRLHQILGLRPCALNKPGSLDSSMESHRKSLKFFKDHSASWIEGGAGSNRLEDTGVSEDQCFCHYLGGTVGLNHMHTSTQQPYRWGRCGDSRENKDT